MVLLAVQATGKDLATAAFVVRDSAGLIGLAAAGAAVCGGQYAWTLPFAWLSFSFFAPPPTSVPTQVASWMMLPPGTAAGTWTALVLTISRHHGLRRRGTEAVAGPGYRTGARQGSCALRTRRGADGATGRPRRATGP